MSIKKSETETRKSTAKEYSAAVSGKSEGASKNTGGTAKNGTATKSAGSLSGSKKAAAKKSAAQKAAEAKAQAAEAAAQAQRLKTEKNNRAFAAALRVIFAASFLLVGLYYEITCAAASVALCVLLLWRLKSSGSVKIHLNLAMAAPCLIWIFYLLSAIWAVDRGLALWGAVKYLPLPLFALCITQTAPENRRLLIADIPWIGAGMTVLSFGLQYVPAFNSFFSVNGRLAGLFGYPNTFACLLLIGIVILITDKRTYKYKWTPPVCFLILLFGLIQAGSRTIYIIAVPIIIAALIAGRSKKLLIYAGAAAAAVVLVGIAAFFGISAFAERVSSISLSSESFLVRLLYYKDLLPVILKHPFGLGYLGYYITQGSFQSGLYSVRWVHNDFLQLFADTGWIPAIAAAAAAIRALFSKNLTAQLRIIMLALLAHCMLDFDLEFISMYFILLLCLDWESGKSKEAHFSFALPLPFAAAAAALSIWIGIASTFTYAGLHAGAAKIYPWNTLSETELLTQISDMDELDELADKILSRDEYISLAWDAKALAAYSDGNFGNYITYKQNAISLNPYSIEEYEDYFEKLSIGVELYIEAGDEASAQICLDEIENIQTMLDELEASTSALAYKTSGIPTFTMPDEYYEYLETIE